LINSASYGTSYVIVYLKSIKHH